MHLTNYSINKNSKDFIKDDDEGGSKRSVPWKGNNRNKAFCMSNDSSLLLLFT